MPRYRVEINQVPKEFEDLLAAERFVQTLPRGTCATVEDRLAKPGETASYTYVAGEAGCVKRRHLPNSPLQ